MNEPLMTEVKRIHLIFKTHLDVGFTDFSANVVKNYIEQYIPKAIALAQQLRETGSSDRFIWTTGSWLIYEYLEQAKGAERSRMEEAIRAGDIRWHALPFTTHSENMDVNLFRFGLSLSQKLDHRFGKQTIAAKMTDVPGHTRGIVPLLEEAGVKFLHIGVNAASTPPDVPPVFVWRDPSGAEVAVMYHKGSYGDLMIVPGMTDAIAFAHTGDNLGPQTAEQLHHTYQLLRDRFPGVDITASTMDAFAGQLMQVKSSLPVVTQEIGDTWIHGAATDPLKEARYRELLRWQQDCLEAGTSPETFGEFDRKLLTVPEHTWGLDVKTHLQDWRSYRAADFKTARSQENFKKMETSWQEQRNYIQAAVDALPEPLKIQAEERLSALRPLWPDTAGFSHLQDPSQPRRMGQFEAAFDSKDGSITHLAADGVDWAGTANPLGRFWYETFSADDYQRFHRQYNVNKRETREWAIPDFTKPGIEPWAREHKTFIPHLTWAGCLEQEDQDIYLCLLEMPEESWQEYGAPRKVALKVSFDRQKPVIHFDLQWFEKTACRLPEAAWFSFVPILQEPRRWRMEKLGQWISPLEVIRDGNRHLHALGKGARTQSASHVLLIDTLDTVLLAPGAPSLLDFNNRQPDLRKGLHFNLVNNLWGTNFPMWYEEDARFRFNLEAAPV